MPRAELLRKLSEAREENRTWRHELIRKQRQLENLSHSRKARLAEETQRYEAALAEERKAAAAVQRELGSEEQRHRALSLEVSALRGMVSAAQAELGELEHRIQIEKEQRLQAEFHSERLMQQRESSPIAPPEASTSTSSHASTMAGDAQPVQEASLVLIINLDRRTDRLERVMSLPWGFRPTRLSAVDGKTLHWDDLVTQGQVSKTAVADSQWAEESNLPTVCRETGSFSPHLTLPAVGCALSHRNAWECLASHPVVDWALIVEDDVDALAPNFEAQLQAVIRSLPRSWQMCYLGYHESSGSLLAAHETPKLMEATEDGLLTGLFGYLLRQNAAKALLDDVTLFPLRHQVDVALSHRKWQRRSRFALAPGGVLLSSPRSEDGDCDTDVQTLGEPGIKAHAQVPDDWLKASGAKLLF